MIREMSPRRRFAWPGYACYFDFATPHLASDYTFSHLGLDATREKNIETAYYDAGHMVYIHEPSLKKLSGDLYQFVQASSNI